MLHHLSSFKQPIPGEYRCHKRLQEPGLQGDFNSVGEMKGATAPAKRVFLKVCLFTG
jgi:hypothetical protein